MKISRESPNEVDYKPDVSKDRGGVHLTEATLQARSSSSVDGFCSEVAQMKAKIPYFWFLYFFCRSEFGITPKNEANHRRTGDFETIYFQFWGGLVGLVIDSMGRVLTI